jgi:hypothetical protein
MEILSLKVRTPWYKESEYNKKLGYCDGSRNHGCGGCFCRNPQYAPYRCVCTQCGKYMYELLDAIWEIRQDVYRQYAFKEMSYEQLFFLEFQIEEELATLCSGADWMSRSEILKKYTGFARKITDRVIKREMDKIDASYFAAVTYKDDTD